MRERLGVRGVWEQFPASCPLPQLLTSSAALNLQVCSGVSWYLKQPLILGSSYHRCWVNCLNILCSRLLHWIVGQQKPSTLLKNNTKNNIKNNTHQFPRNCFSVCQLRQGSAQLSSYLSLKCSENQLLECQMAGKMGPLTRDPVHKIP